MKVRLTVYTLRKLGTICRDSYQEGRKYPYSFEDLFTTTEHCGMNCVRHKVSIKDLGFKSQPNRDD